MVTASGAQQDGRGWSGPSVMMSWSLARVAAT
jgi:hypothetical protein